VKLPNLTELDLQRRMEETPHIQVFLACSITRKKTEGCNRCQRCFNKVLGKGSEYLCKCDISVFLIDLLKFLKNNILLLCHNGVLCVDLCGKLNNLMMQPVQDALDGAH
jgi:hypothetical protein